MSLWGIVSQQFKKPSGALGRISGYIMSHRSSNIERSEWGISLLNIQPSDIILETGFGPGLGLKKISEIITNGMVYGLDHSELMVKQASERNFNAIKSGKIKLFSGGVSKLPEFENLIDKILDVNSFQFWNNKIDTLKSLKAIMKPGGIIALVHQPRKPGATENDSIEAGDKFYVLLKQAGFINIERHKKIMKPVPVICLTGINNEIT
jgi:ubiquinone/menaquinone biosynthesis C-methylase UbiE